jgi:iron-sulfur cluster repair protein YtfE (RIC family)
MRHWSLIPLSHDHHHGLALGLRCRKQALGRLKPMGTEGLRLRAGEFCEFFDKQLMPHFRAEEEILFPLMREAVPQSAALLDELICEHQLLKRAAGEIARGAGLSKALFDAGDILERHIRKEERELFPLYEAHIDEARAGLAGEEMKKLLAEGQNR